MIMICNVGVYLECARRADFAAFEMTDTTATCTTDMFPPAPLSSASSPRAAGEGPPSTLAAGLQWALLATSAAIETAVAVTSTPTLEGGRVVASDDAAATVMAARPVADEGILDVDDPAAATA